MLDVPAAERQILFSKGFSVWGARDEGGVFSILTSLSFDFIGKGEERVGRMHSDIR